MAKQGELITADDGDLLDRVNWCKKEIVKYQAQLPGLENKVVTVHLQIAEALATAHAEMAGAGRDGSFGPWVERHELMSKRTAYNYLAVWDRLGSVQQLHTCCEWSALIALAPETVPDGAISEAKKRAKRGETITQKDAKAIIKEAKGETGSKSTKSDSSSNGMVKCDACDGTGKVKSQADSVGLVLDHYKSHHPKSKAGQPEKAKIAARLREGFTVDELCQAIDGNHISPFHCGENAQGTRYHKIGLIFRSADQVQQFIGMADDPPAAVGEKTRRTNRAAEDFVHGR